MQTHCAKSCGLCVPNSSCTDPPPCYDAAATGCAGLVSLGMCDSHVGLMRIRCAKSCNLC